MKGQTLRVIEVEGKQVGDMMALNHYTCRPPVAEKGDYVDFRAEMDLLVAISACPTESEINDYAGKPLKVEIRQA
jgi:uncharacterized protein YcgI (DUF1989 family)